MPEILDGPACDRLTDGDWRPSPTRGRSESTVSTAGVAKPRLVRDVSGRGAWTIPASGNPPWLELTIRAFGSLLVLQPDWDTYGAPRIDPAIIRSALDLLNTVMRSDSPAPSVVPTSRGGIQLEWHTRGIDLEVEFLSPARVYGSFEDLRTGESWESDLTFDVTRLSQSILRLSRV